VKKNRLDYGVTYCNSDTFDDKTYSAPSDGQSAHIY